MAGVATLSPADWIAAVTAAATIAGVIVVFFQLRQLTTQIRLQHFADYTKRYQEIFLHLPEHVHEANFKLVGQANYKRIMRYLRAYFDLTFEEWYLNRKGLIDFETWSLWESGIKTALAKTALRQAWEIISADTNFGSEFKAFVDSRIHSRR